METNEQDIDPRADDSANMSSDNWNPEVIITTNSVNCLEKEKKIITTKIFLQLDPNGTVIIIISD